MSTLTPNYNLIKPDSTDPFGDFRQDYNDNMDIIDANLGGGGGGGGHTILDGDGNALPQEDDLQFTGACSVTDDNVNGRTVVNVEACIEVTQAEYDALPASKLTDDIAYFVVDGESDEYKAKADKTDLASIQITGSTNDTGSTITSGTYFYLNDTLVRAKTDIANGATLTLNTNYEVVTAGALNDTIIRYKTISGTGSANLSLALGQLTENQYLNSLLAVSDGVLNAQAAIMRPADFRTGLKFYIASNVPYNATYLAITWTARRNDNNNSFVYYEYRQPLNGSYATADRTATITGWTIYVLERS